MKSAWNDVLDRVAEAKERVKCGKLGPWFRGQSKAEYSLQPSLLRIQGKTRTRLARLERNLYTSAVTRGGHHVSGATSSWDVLARMQHHGIPTRLLDWTESFAVALYFALHPPSDRRAESPCIWVLNPFRLSRDAAGERGTFTIATNALPDYYESFVRKRKDKDSDKAGDSYRGWPYDAPVAAESPWAHDRIYAQKGFFTIHGNDTRPMDDICPERVAKIVLPGEALPDAQRFLDLAGVNHYTVFLDLDGLSRQLRERYRY